MAIFIFMSRIWEIFSINYSGFLLAQSAWALMVLRVVSGAIFLSDGFRKIKLIGNKQQETRLAVSNFRRLVNSFVIVLENIGGILLILGVFTQIISLLFAVRLLAASFWKIRRGGDIGKDFWFGIILGVSALVLTTNGGGSFSLGNYFGFF